MNDKIEDVRGGGVRPHGLARPNRETKQSRSLTGRKRLLKMYCNARFVVRYIILE
ncbi:hypothetical protein [Oryza sativa Japonica Group]|uniref:Uncharacterized protein n=1 Tax=Oryza sativa subsp. japonica TaxID=39947 RepID=Q9LWN9_ORYSJ|nr:hypothetical protein [Oryza sativa Japonica Group]